MQTVLITGCSTGFGREIAARFLAEGWRVVATMRNPAANTLPLSEHLSVLPLDVTDAESIRTAFAKTGDIDVLVNNAGIGWLNAVEGTPIEMVRRLFETNTFAPIAMMQAVLPGMRERRAGAIVNVSSSVTIKPLPLLSVYRASKAALNALTEAAALELAPFGIRIAAVLPGSAPATNFGANARAQIMANGGFHEAYSDFTNETLARMQEAAGGPVTTAEDVAEAVWRAAVDPDCQTILPAGADATAWFEGR